MAKPTGAIAPKSENPEATEGETPPPEEPTAQLYLILETFRWGFLYEVGTTHDLAAEGIPAGPGGIDFLTENGFAMLVPPGFDSAAFMRARQPEVAE
jgi:hypothetical protein